MELKIDPSRKEFATGIFVRAKDGDKWGSFDIAELDRESLHSWLRSRGGENLWAENCVLSLLGHEQIQQLSENDAQSK